MTVPFMRRLVWSLVWAAPLLVAVATAAPDWYAGLGPVAAVAVGAGLALPIHLAVTRALVRESVAYRVALLRHWGAAHGAWHIDEDGCLRIPVIGPLDRVCARAGVDSRGGYIVAHIHGRGLLPFTRTIRARVLLRPPTPPVYVMGTSWDPSVPPVRMQVGRP